MSLIKQDNTLKVSTHAGTFSFEKIGRILSKESYNEHITKQGFGRKLYKSSYGYKFDKNPTTVSGCYIIFETDKEQPSYIGKTTNIFQRFSCHICEEHFVQNTQNGKQLDIFFCPSTQEFSAGNIEALMLGYLWNKDLWNRF